MGEVTDIIQCSNETCLCDGSNAGYKDCQSCCCAIKKRFEGNGSHKFESSSTSEIYIDLLKISCFRDFRISTSCNTIACILEKTNCFSMFDHFVKTATLLKRSLWCG